MSMFIPDKIILATLAAGLTAIKVAADIDDYLADIFDSTVVGADYIANVKTFLNANKIYIKQGYAIDDEKHPAWYVCPTAISSQEHFIGDIVDSGVDTGTGGVIENAYEVQTHVNTASIRIITASTNADVSLFLDTIARYIVLMNEQALSTLGLFEISCSTSDLDPIYQYLPEGFSYRTTSINCRGMDQYSLEMDVIDHIHLYMTFSDNENPSEIQII